MSGFFTKDLAFNSGMGAFLAGAAKQGTQEIEQMAANDRQQGVLNQAALFKLDKGISDYKKDEKQRDKQRDDYQTILDDPRINGNREAADAVFARKNLFKSVNGDQLNAIIEGVKGDFQNKTPDPNYKSKIITNLDLQSADAYGGVQNKLQLLNPSLRGALDPGNPLAHNQSSSANPQGSGQGGGSYGGSGVDNPGGQQQASAPQPTDTTTQPSTQPNITPTGTSQSAIDATNGAAPSGAPIPLDNPQPATPDAGTNPYNPTDTGTPAPIVATPGGGTSAPAPNAIPGTPPTPSTPSSPNPYSPAPTGQPVQPSPNRYGAGPKVGTGLSNVNPNDPSHYASRADMENALVTSGMPKDKAHALSSGAWTQTEINANEQAKFTREHPNQMTPLMTQFSKDLGNETSKGPYSLIAQSGFNEAARNADAAVQLITSGNMKTGAMQPMYDSVSRLGQAIGLEPLKIANNVEAYNYLNKIQSMMQFGEIGKYHLGRWTQMEVGLLARQVLSGATDPSTNVKLALLVGKTAEFSRDTIAQVRAAAGHGTPQEIGNAIDMRNSLAAKALSNQTDNALPWTAIDPHDPNSMKQVQATAQPGQWIEDKTTQKMYQVQANDANQLVLKPPGANAIRFGKGQ